MLQKIPYPHRVGLSELSYIVEAVNQIIDKLNQKIEVEKVAVERVTKDFTFFKGEETKLPYHQEFTITSNEEATKVFEMYNLTYKEIKQINDIIIKWNIVALTIDVVEEVTEKEKKQEVTFEKIETLDLDKPIKVKWKRGRPKKRTSWK